MNIVEKILYFLQGEMERPTSYGWYHFLWIILTIICIVIIVLRKNKYNESSLKKVLLFYGIISLILELLKQIVWSFNYDPVSNIVTWDYNWYAFPYQLCSTPIYLSLICAFLKKGKLRDNLLSCIAYVTILGSLATFLYPESCFVRTILVNIHTMYLHCGSLILSIYLLVNGVVKINKKSFLNGYFVFLCLAIVALVMNIIMFKSGILNGEDFNMFYISPYFISSLPLFDILQKNLPYIIFLFLYLLAIFLGASIVYLVAKCFTNKKSDIIKKNRR